MFPKVLQIYFICKKKKTKRLYKRYELFSIRKESCDLCSAICDSSECRSDFFSPYLINGANNRWVAKDVKIAQNWGTRSIGQKCKYMSVCFLDNTTTGQDQLRRGVRQDRVLTTQVGRWHKSQRVSLTEVSRRPVRRRIS